MQRKNTTSDKVHYKSEFQFNNYGERLSEVNSFGTMKYPYGEKKPSKFAYKEAPKHDAIQYMVNNRIVCMKVNKAMDLYKTTKIVRAPKEGGSCFLPNKPQKGDDSEALLGG